MIGKKNSPFQFKKISSIKKISREIFLILLIFKLKDRLKKLKLRLVRKIRPFNLKISSTKKISREIFLILLIFKLKDRLKKLKLRLVRKIRPFNLKNKQYQEKFRSE